RHAASCEIGVLPVDVATVVHARAVGHDVDVEGDILVVAAGPAGDAGAVDRDFRSGVVREVDVCDQGGVVDRGIGVELEATGDEGACAAFVLDGQRTLADLGLEHGQRTLAARDRLRGVAVELGGGGRAVHGGDGQCQAGNGGGKLHEAVSP